MFKELICEAIPDECVNIIKSYMRREIRETRRIIEKNYILMRRDKLVKIVEKWFNENKHKLKKDDLGRLMSRIEGGDCDWLKGGFNYQSYTAEKIRDLMFDYNRTTRGWLYKTNINSLYDYDYGKNYLEKAYGLYSVYKYVKSKYEPKQKKKLIIEE